MKTSTGRKKAISYVFSRLIWGYGFGYILMMLGIEAIKQGASSPRPDFLARCNPTWEAVPSASIAGQTVVANFSDLEGQLRRLATLYPNREDLDKAAISRGLPTWTQLNSLLQDREVSYYDNINSSSKKEQQINGIQIESLTNDAFAPSFAQSSLAIRALKSDPVYPAGKVYAVCNGDSSVITEGRKSFPSGHASSSFFSFLYPVLVMQRQWSYPSASHLRFVIQTIFMGLAGYVTASRYADYWHRPIDLIIGSILGIVFAVWSEYMCYRRSSAAILLPTEKEQMYEEAKAFETQNIEDCIFAEVLSSARAVLENRGGDLSVTTLLRNKVLYEDDLETLASLRHGAVLRDEESEVAHLSGRGGGTNNPRHNQPTIVDLPGSFR